MKQIIYFFLIAISFFGKSQKFKVKKVISVYDGDTFRADLFCNLEIFCKNIPVRLAGADTPEIRGKCPQEKNLSIKAREFTKNFLSKGAITLRNSERGKYFRIVAEVYVNGKSLTKELIKSKLAVPYYGGKKIKNWCE